MAVYGYVRLCRAMQDCVWLFMGIHGYVAPCRDMYGHVGLCRTMYCFLWLYRTIQGYVCCICRAVYGYVWLCRSMQGYVWLCMPMQGYVWLCMAMYGSVGLCRAMYGYLGICMAMQGCVWQCRALYDYVGICMAMQGYNRRQNELRHFAQKWAFLRFMNFKRRKYSFPPPSPPCNVVPLFQLPIENKKLPNFEWRGQGRGANSFVLRSHPI